MQKINFDTLVARAEQRNRSKTEAKLFDIPGFGALEFLRPSTERTLEYYAQIAETEGALGALDISSAIIYDCCPMLQNAELHTALGIKDPADVVPMLLPPVEIDLLSGQLLVWLGLARGKAEGTAKN